MKRIDELMGTVDRGVVTHTKQQSQQWQSNSEVKGMTKMTSSKFWLEMQGIYSDRWAARNGRAPTLRWREAISSLSDQHLQAVINACVQRCCSGNTFAPDLAEFMALASAWSASNVFGLESADVMEEFRRYCRERYRYSCAEKFPWRQPVLYWICCDMRREMHQRNLDDHALERRAEHHLQSWAKKVARGEQVPIPKPLLSESRNPPTREPGPGHAAAMEILQAMRDKNQI